jgi:hypothetical protein
MAERRGRPTVGNGGCVGVQVGRREWCAQRCICPAAGDAGWTWCRGRLVGHSWTEGGRDHSRPCGPHPSCVLIHVSEYGLSPSSAAASARAVLGDVGGCGGLQGRRRREEVDGDAERGTEQMRATNDRPAMQMGPLEIRLFRSRLPLRTLLHPANSRRTRPSIRLPCVSGGHVNVALTYFAILRTYPSFIPSPTLSECVSPLARH